MMNQKVIIILLFAFQWIGAQKNQKYQKISYFQLQDVQLLDSNFKNAMNVDKHYILSLNPDRLLAPYFKEAGLKTNANNYPNWENTGLDGHIGGHYLSALSLMYASTGDSKIKERLDYMINQLEICQNASGNGYISGIPNGKAIWKEISEGKIYSSLFSLNDRWVPLYNIHKTYSGLRDAYWYTDNQKAKKMLIKLTDWMINTTSKLSRDQIQNMLVSEYGGLNEVFADVYNITGDKKYLKLAKDFSQDTVLNPLLEKKDVLTGMHANTQIPKVIGFKRIADIENNQNWNQATDLFWQNVVHKRSVAIGGNSVSEHFNPITDFSGMMKSVEGPETCNTYNMLKLSKDLFATSGSSSYMDYYEKALYNHILSTQHDEKGGFVYFTPMRPGHYRVYSQSETSFWCCVGSGLENHGKYGEMIYAHTEQDLLVNLFIPSKLNWKEKNVTVTQINHFPESSETKLIFNLKNKSKFNLKLRIPDWTNNSEVKILINNKEYPINKDQDGYSNINKTWKNGDVVVMQLPMHLSAEQLPDGSDYYAFKYGPIVLAAKYGTENQLGLFADDSRGGHIAHGTPIPLNDIPVIVGKSSSVLEHIKKENTQGLKFKLDGVYPKEKFKDGLELVPFNTIQAERYIIYWPQADEDKIEELMTQKAKEEQELRKLESIIEDKISLGEQQPESDHFFKSPDSYAGYFDEYHFRDSKAWFSYEMRNKNKKAKFLYISYFDLDKNRSLNIEINGENIISKTLDGSKGASLQHLVIPIPPSEYDKETLIVKIIGKEEQYTAKIVGIRLLNQNIN